ncbi:MAG: BLUF domain-containing protein [Methylocystaceae bacterium]|nr:BLUF domain-containing protein [Methylocystaceae bacterium]
MLTRLAYSSVARADLKEDDLQRIIQTCRDFNAAEEITGVLVYTGESFIQILEGTDRILDVVLAKIIADDRHYDIEILIRSEITKRAFSKWSMGFLILQDPDARRFTGLSSYSEILASLTDTWETQDSFITSCIKMLNHQMCLN